MKPEEILEEKPQEMIKVVKNKVKDHQTVT